MASASNSASRSSQLCKGLEGGLHYMIDLETLSTKTNAVICSIGVVEFDIFTGECTREFYRTINLQSCLDLGLEVEGNTLIWWLTQSTLAKEETYKKNSTGLNSVLQELNIFLPKKYTTFYVWGNGSSFDLGILSNAYNKCGKEIPWKFWNERDVRTLLTLYPDAKQLTKNEGVPHYPIDDCKYQIQYCSEVIKFLRQNK